MIEDTGDGKWKAEQGEGDLESTRGGGWSRQTSQTKQRLSGRKPEMNQQCSWEQGVGGEDSRDGEPAPGRGDAQVPRRKRF